MKTKTILLLLGLLPVFLVVACSDSEPSMTIDEMAITDELDNDLDDLYNIDLIADGDGFDFAKSAGVDAPIEPRGYGRRVRDVRNQRIESRDVKVDVAEDRLSAVALITFNLRGVFVIHALDTVTHTRSIYTKPFVHTIQRRAAFVRNPDTTAAKRWLRNWISPAYGISRNGTLSLTGDITITVTHSDESTDVTTINQDPLTSQFTVNDFPTLTPGDVVTITVPVANSDAGDAPYAIVHRGRHVQPLSRVKNVFNDEGLDGDAAAGDGTYTVQWTVQDTGFAGYHLGIIDVFSTSTIFDDTLPYNSLVVALPYLKQ